MEKFKCICTVYNIFLFCVLECFDGISVLAWNCNGLTAEKRENEDFSNILKENDIVFST